METMLTGQGVYPTCAMLITVTSTRHARSSRRHVNKADSIHVYKDIDCHVTPHLIKLDLHPTLPAGQRGILNSI
jgi:hypothetical protein